MTFLDENSPLWSRLESLSRIFKKISGNAGVGYTGGKNPLINKKLYETINSLSGGGLKVTEDNFLLFAGDVRDYINKKVGDRWFIEKLYNISSGEDNEGKSYLFSASEESILSIFLFDLFYWDTKDGELVAEKSVQLSSEDRSLINERIIKMADDGELEKITTEVIGEILTEYTLDKYNAEVGNRVSQKIRDLSRTTNIGISKEFYEKYLDLKEGEEFIEGKPVATLTKNIYRGGEDRPKIPLESIKDKSILLFFKREAVGRYPANLIKDPQGETIESAKNELEQFDALEGKDLSTYQFRHILDFEDSENLFGWDLGRNASDSWFESLYKWISNTESSAEFIKRKVSGNYLDFLRAIAGEARDRGEISQTIGDFWSKSLEESQWIEIFELIVMDKLIVAKKEFFKLLEKELSDEDDTPGQLTDDELSGIYNKQAEAFIKGDAEDVQLPTEEEIKNRQKYFKQCALMMNLPTLRRTYDDTLKNRYEDKKLFDDRFYMAHCAEGGQEKLLSNLLTSANEQKLLEIPGHILSSLVPKVRLFKVAEKGDKMTNTEFIFNATSDNKFERSQDGKALIAENARREEEFKKSSKSNGKQALFLAEDFDKGNGCGLKEFSFEFNGTNPAEARNDIKATLKLYFQSFNDFIRERKSSNGKTYRYVDLIIQPKPDETNINIISDRHYEPSFYRIRADIGYHTDGIQDEEIRKAIEVSNKTMFLNMVDHDIQFKSDGSVEISISYRAYLESLLKHPRLDALASPELIKKRQENAKLLADELSSKRCTKEKIQELQISIAAAETVIIRRSLSSIVDRLRKRGVIYSTRVKENDRKQFLRDGFFKRCELETEIKIPESGNKESGDTADVGVVLNSGLPENSEDFNFLNSSNSLVQFFFFGDLLYTILDCVYETGGKLRRNSGFQNSKILLGSFEFDPFQITSIDDRVFNIAHIPISVDFFSRWFVDEVMAQKSTRKSFPVLNFMRSLTNQLIKPSLLENCVNRNVDKTLRFQTSQITAYHEGKVDPLSPYNTEGKEGEVGIEVMKLRKGGKLPLRGGGSSDDLNNLHNYIVLSTAGSSLSYSGNGKYFDDIEQGRLHVNIGQNNGLVKSISLSKSDQQYIREARFFQQGIDGLLQLSAVYVATLEMFGNTLFYPGMEFFFNPYGLGGALHFGSPTDPNSVANKLGIGGYHTITSVRSTITPGSFKTTVAGQQYYSGDGSGNPNLQGKGSQKKENESLERYEPEQADNRGCNTVILGVQNFNPDRVSTRVNDLEGSINAEEQFREANESDPNSPIVSTSTGQNIMIPESGPGVFEVGGELRQGEFFLAGPYENEVFFEYTSDTGSEEVVSTGRIIEP